ncbi:tRNA lysidine(34) synthetase TilS [Methylobacterium sp. Leaf108]|uniref:tRNA lysidine(34) synthetase TilS n=1 Tax=Methylobacterium sp. Leaf108 TaxID=1736256 RepID=UPI000A79FC1E|nr:tRNA lysidine(34) synthetase TilS [Methylobacterium sp. Leaf108]
MNPDGSGDALAQGLAPFLAAASPGIVLAVSGGPDSTALMHAAAAFGRGRLHVATVDHDLRPGSADEAARVATAAGALRLSHATLLWEGAKPATGIAAAARAARYRLLADYARAVGADLVLTGHTADDQAETVLLRLLAGSGAAGLAGMSPVRDLAPGLRLGRPFLSLPKSALVAYCEDRGIAYESDPSNADDRFARARLRRAMPLLAHEGLTPERLCRLAARSRRDEIALAGLAHDALTRASRPDRDGIVLDGRALAALPEAVALRVIGRALAGRGGSVRLDRLERLVFEALLPALRKGAPMRRTLAGHLVAVTERGDVAVTLAPPRRPAGRPCPVGLAAAPPDLLGKGEAAAYIVPACQD